MHSEIRLNALNKQHKFDSKVFLSHEEQERVEQLLLELKDIFQAQTVSLGEDIYATDDVIDVKITLSGVPNFTKGFNESVDL